MESSGYLMEQFAAAAPGRGGEALHNQMYGGWLEGLSKKFQKYLCRNSNIKKC